MLTSSTTSVIVGLLLLASFVLSAYYGINSVSAKPDKEFYLFTTEIAGVDEEKLKLPGDGFSIPTLVVNKGDNVTIHFYNVDPNVAELHSFTIDSPYSMDVSIAGGESKVVSFIADHEGIFQYYCKYHLPVMVGQLVVIS